MERKRERGSGNGWDREREGRGWEERMGQSEFATDGVRESGGCDDSVHVGACMILHLERGMGRMSCLDIINVYPPHLSTLPLLSATALPAEIAMEDARRVEIIQTLTNVFDDLNPLDEVHVTA
jgi:hypothetical protein